MIYRVKVAKSFGARQSSQRAQWSNVYGIRTEHALDSPEIVTSVMHIVAFEKSFHLDVVQFMHMSITTPENEGRSGHPEASRSIPLTGAGVVPVTDIALALSTDICWVVKHGAVLGRPAMWRYRGCLTEAMVRGSASGQFELLAPIVDLQARWGEMTTTTNSVTIVIIPKGSSNNDDGRLVTAVADGGVMCTRRDHNRRKPANLFGN